MIRPVAGEADTAPLPDPAGLAAAHEVEDTSIAGICDHIAASHHGRLRAILPEISAMAATVVRVHGDKDPDLAAQQAVFETLRGGIEAHLAAEEEVLFPVWRGLAGGREEPAGSTRAVPADADRLAAVHAGFTGALAELRSLADGYDPASAFCNTHRGLRHRLHLLETDLQLQLRDETELLLPLVRRYAAAGPGAVSAPLVS